MTLSSHAELQIARPKTSANTMQGSRLLNLTFMIGGFYLFSTCIGVLILMFLGR
jgi:hypothetical protein